MSASCTACGFEGPTHWRGYCRDCCLTRPKYAEYLEAENRQLREAVRELYYAAHWSPDRDCDAQRLWARVRNAAGFERGNAPTPREATDETTE